MSRDGRRIRRVLAHHADGEINNNWQWTPNQLDWVSIAFHDEFQICECKCPFIHSFIHSFIMRMSFCGGWRCCPRRCAEDRSSLCTLCVLALLLFPSARIPCNRTPTAASCQVQLARLKCNLLDSSTLQQLHAVQSNGGSGPGLPHTRTHTKRRSSSPKQQSEFVDVSLETNAGGKQHVK
jgi:hypothetical protein